MKSIFVSSTFCDMQAERDILVKEVLHESNDEDNFLEDVFDDNNE